MAVPRSRFVAEPLKGQDLRVAEAHVDDEARDVDGVDR
jgi:hypothetical protein